MGEGKIRFETGMSLEEMIVNGKRIENIEELEKIRSSEYASEGENYKPVSADILKSAIEAFRHMQVDAKEEEKENIELDYLRATLIDLGSQDNTDGEIAILIEDWLKNKTTHFGGGHTALYLGRKWLESGSLPDKIASLVKSLREDEKHSEGMNMEYSIHFVGAI